MRNKSSKSFCGKKFCRKNTRPLGHAIFTGGRLPPLPALSVGNNHGTHRGAYPTALSVGVAADSSPKGSDGQLTVDNVQLTIIENIPFVSFCAFRGSVSPFSILHSAFCIVNYIPHHHHTDCVIWLRLGCCVGRCDRKSSRCRGWG